MPTEQQSAFKAQREKAGKDLWQAGTNSAEWQEWVKLLVKVSKMWGIKRAEVEEVINPGRFRLTGLRMKLNEIWEDTG